MRWSESRRGVGGMGLRILYWLVVLAVSLLIVYVFLRWLESLDDSSLDSAVRSLPGFGSVA